MSQHHKHQNKKPKKPRPHRNPVGTPGAAPPDFSTKCHFTLHNFKCKHHTWLENPKITHVQPCKCKQHKNLCGNMAKANNEVWLDEMCESCQSLVPLSEPNSNSPSGLQLDTKLRMAEAVKKRISELELEEKIEEKKNVVSDGIPPATTTLTTPASTLLPSSPLAPKSQAVTMIRDWGLFGAPIPPKPESKSTPKQRTDENNQTASNAEPSRTPETTNIYSISSPQNPESNFDDGDSDDDDEEQFRIGKDRVEWLSLPEDTNGTGSADKGTGIVERIYNTLTGKRKPKFVLKKPKPEEQEKKEPEEDSDQDVPWEDQGDWVHVVENVEDN